jgi:hypothetical protein
MNKQPDAHQTATIKEKFDLGVGMLKGYYDGLEARAERTAVLLVGVVGWLITSQTARDSLAKNRPLFVGAVLSLTVFLIMSWANISHFLKRFREIQSAVEDLGYVDAKYFTRYRMPRSIRGIPVLYIYMMPALILYVFIVLLLFHIRFNVFTG